jgi:hypothetical protein
MDARIYLPLAIALGLIAVPAVAQPANPPPDRDRTMMNRDARMHDTMQMHDERSHHDRMDRRGSDWRTMRWCRSMSYRRMMRNPRCRWLMHRHSGRMHHM